MRHADDTLLLTLINRNLLGCDIHECVIFTDVSLSALIFYEYLVRFSEVIFIGAQNSLRGTWQSIKQKLLIGSQGLNKNHQMKNASMTFGVRHMSIGPNSDWNDWLFPEMGKSASDNTYEKYQHCNIEAKEYMIGSPLIFELSRCWQWIWCFATFLLIVWYQLIFFAP